MTPGKLDISVEVLTSKRVALLKLNGSLDEHTFQIVAKAVAELFEQGCYKLIFDLTNLAYLSSAGCGELISGVSEAATQDGRIVLLNPSPFVENVLKLVELQELLPIARNIHEALALFK